LLQSVSALFAALRLEPASCWRSLEEAVHLLSVALQPDESVANIASMADTRHSLPGSD